MDDLLADFLTETNESLGELDMALVRLERNPADRETLGLIFRLVHTIKGTCGFFGLPRLERVAHAAENVLGRVRDGALGVSPDLISAVLAAADAIKAIVAGLGANGAEPAGDDAAVIAVLDAINEGRAAAPEPAEAAVAAAVAPEPVAPAAVAPEPVAAAAAAAVPAPGDAAASAEATVAGQTIRVGVDVLEDLMTLVSELVLTRNQLLQLSRTQESSEFAAPLQRLSQITSDLQEGVMKTRMQPIGNAWNKLPRLVRDLSRELGKRIELAMLGADTELDRQVLELIKDPLTHMVRNSADHGLESPDDRRAAGKPETGRITLNAYHEGGHIVIEIADDGRGLPLERIRAKALSQGLATEAELATMPAAALQRLIFHPGFSTAAAVTAVSGRGVGMDVVKTNIERIGGTVDLHSTAGAGTTLTIKIPLTLAIVSALIVAVGRERFAIPQISVLELVRIGAGGRGAAEDAGATTAIERIDGTPVLRLRDRLLPLVGLGETLRLDDAAPPAAPTIVVTQVGASTLGIIVDRVFDTEEIVVKPVAPILRHMTMFSGNTILGDGSVIMILDPNGLARAVGLGAGGDGRAAVAADGAGEATHSAERISLLLFRAGSSAPKAVPLGLIARLEDIPRDRIEQSGGQPVTQYRGQLMPLVSLGAPPDAARPSQPVLVFSDRDRWMGLMVDQIVDVVQDRLQIQLAVDRPGILGTAVIAGAATEVIDTGHYLTQATRDWFRDGAGGAGTTTRLLIVEDSDFFRQLLMPTLAAAGYHVTAARDATRALALREAGAAFDLIVSDIEMPGLDGFGFVREVRAGGAWARLPVVALTGRARPEDEAAARDAGFTDYVVKLDRQALLASLRRCLETQTAAGAVR